MEIEFVHSAPDPEDSGPAESASEVIEAGRPRRWPRIMNIVAAAAVVAGGITWWVTRDGDPAPVIAALPTRGPVAPDCADTSVPCVSSENPYYPGLLQDAIAQHEAQERLRAGSLSFPPCLAGHTCSLSNAPSTAAGAAILDAFPRGYVDGTTTVRDGSTLWFRSVQATVGQLLLTIQVMPVAQAAADDSLPLDRGAGTAAIRAIVRAHGDYVVSVQVRGPDAAIPSRTSLLALASDGRLAGSG